MKVYRIEDENGNGPYTSKKNRAFSERLIFSHCNPAEHPGPFTDGLEDVLWRSQYPNSQLLFGFLSEVQAFDWFYDFWDELSDNGFVLVEYEAELYWSGNSGKQILFFRE